MPKHYNVQVGKQASMMALRQAFPNGGGQAACSVSPFDKDFVAYETDTGGVRISTNGIESSIVHDLGWSNFRNRQTDGVVFSRLARGRLFMTCGDGTAGPGGLYVCENSGQRQTVTQWTRLDGVAGGSSNLVFDGGNNNATGAPLRTYARHYGGTIAIDEDSIAGYTLIHVATVNNGAWRIKMRNSDLVAVEQIQYAGTAGTYVRCLRQATFPPNAAGNDYSRIIISLYHSGTPVKPVLCTNANDAGASPTLSTATITNAPTNVEAMAYAKASGAQPVTVFVGLNYVYLSVDAFTAAAGSITMTNVARTTVQADGPENNVEWISAGTTQEGTNHIILVGTFGGRSISGGYNTAWRGVVAKSSTTPWSAITWTALNGSTYFSEQCMGLPGADNTNWITNQNTPGRNGTAAISGFSTSATDPNRMYLISRGAAYRSDDAGLHWFATRQFGSADHTWIAWDKWTNKSNLITSTGDWPMGSYQDNFVTEPNIVIDVANANGNGAFFDPKTGEAFCGGSLDPGASHAVPATSNYNTLWGIAAANLGNTYTTIGTGVIDYNLNTGAGVDTNVGGVLGGACAYGTGGTGSTRAIVVATNGSHGMWYTKNNGTTWAQVLADSGTIHPFDNNSQFETTSIAQDISRDKLYFMDRQRGTVWRVSVAADGTVSTATRIFVQTWTYALCRDSAGYIEIDEANDRLWISTLNAVWYINNASTAGFVAGTTNATEAGFAANYPGELAGPLTYIPSLSAVAVATLGLNSAGNFLYGPTLNGADGPRFLVVTGATTAGNWATAEDWAVTRDRAYRLAYIAPNGIARNWDGSQIGLTMQGTGVGVWRTGPIV